jgi:hypothetical protein
MIDFITSHIEAFIFVLVTMSLLTVGFAWQARSLRNRHSYMVYLVRRREELLGREERLSGSVMYELGTPQERSQVFKKIKGCREEKLRIEGELFEQLSREL